jgi:hypothetical protein
VTIQKSYFSNGYASIGGAIYIIGDSSLYIEGSEFSDNAAQQFGGAIRGDSL